VCQPIDQCQAEVRSRDIDSRALASWPDNRGGQLEHRGCVTDTREMFDTAEELFIDTVRPLRT
jgi:hypothetical protein